VGCGLCAPVHTHVIFTLSVKGKMLPAPQTESLKRQNTLLDRPHTHSSRRRSHVPKLYAICRASGRQASGWPLAPGQRARGVRFTPLQVFRVARAVPGSGIAGGTSLSHALSGGWVKGHFFSRTLCAPRVITCGRYCMQ
jgi:hypothetical protein